MAVRTLPERLLAVHAALESTGLPHAFGGAIALAYWTLEPRGTRDIDVNVFVPSARAAVVLEALPPEVARPDGITAQLAHDGQARLWWEDTPVDVFLDYEPIHAAAAAHRRVVPFAGAEIPVLGPVELAVFKAMFDRTKDWADIEAVLEAGTATVTEIQRALLDLLDPEDHRFARLREAGRTAAAPS